MFRVMSILYFPSSCFLERTVIEVDMAFTEAASGLGCSDAAIFSDYGNKVRYTYAIVWALLSIRNMLGL